MESTMSNPNVNYRKDYTESNFLIENIELIVEIFDDHTLVTSLLSICKNPAKQDLSNNLILDGIELEFISASIDNKELTPQEYTLDSEHLSIQNVPERFKLSTTCKIYPDKNTSLEGFYRSNVMLCTQCEAEGFRKITYFLDRPDILSTFKTTLKADKEKFPVLLANGNRIDHGDLDQGRHYATWLDPSKKPSYLFAMVAGNLEVHTDSFKTCSGKQVNLEIYVEKANVGKTGHAMESLKKAMKWDEDVYGREYDLDIYMIVATDDFNMGAMENKGLNIFNSKYVLANQDTATDSDYEGIESVIAHEYFHNWTGNRITCRDWFQLSLKEGLTVYRDQQFSGDMNSKSVKRINDVKILRSHQFPEDSGPMAHPVRPESYIEMNNFYTVTVYNKGAEVIRMYHTLLGDEGFYKGMDLYFLRHDGQAVTCDDFLDAMADANNTDLSQFSLWYSQAGTPVLEISDEFDKDKQCYTINIKQNCPATPEQDSKLPFHIPFEFGMLDTYGRDIEIAGKTSTILNITAEESSFTFDGVTEKPVPSFLRGFSAPVKIEYPYTDDQLSFLMSHDSNDFNRWESGQKLAIRMIKNLAEFDKQDSAMEIDMRFITAFKNTLLSHQLDKSFVALALSLPSETYLLETLGGEDIDHILKARNFIRKELASNLRHELMVVYQNNISSEPYSIDAESIGQRSLKNLALGYLIAIEDEETINLCNTQFYDNDNMTDEISALTMLSHTDHPSRQHALDHFYDRWQKEPLVIDKWFAIQAMSKRPGTLNEVKNLMSHPAFNIKNPNKVRALIGSFCQGNLLEFHKNDGTGYKYIASQVLRLDPINPQIAARIVSSLINWKKFDNNRQSLIKEQLEKIVAADDLSKNVFEIASKGLHG
ncbi:MAG: aminopeptidase N [Gammaproteobacteria bacterium]|nr:MAG: aminopeptidase N [Gammaproteobacteria bacterium]